jgi:hypothetical protein
VIKWTLVIIAVTAGLLYAFDRQAKPKLVEVTYEHQMIPEKDTLIVMSYHRTNDGKFFALLPDTTCLWADNIKEIRR